MDEGEELSGEQFTAERVDVVVRAASWEVGSGDAVGVGPGPALVTDLGRARPRPWRTVLLVLIAGAGITALAAAGRSTLAASFRTFAHLRWEWVLLAVFAQGGSMAAFARVQRRLLRVGGGALQLRCVMAVTYAGNAISVSVPLAGPEVSTAFTYRQYNKRGIDPATATWVLAVSGIMSSLSFAVVLAGGAIASGNSLAIALGLSGALVFLFPTLSLLASLRYPTARRWLTGVVERFFSLSRRYSNWPGPGTDAALERFLERLGSLRLPLVQLVEVSLLALWNWVADCVCLAAALLAAGTNVPWHGLVLAYALGMAAGSIGLTPGGLGVIEPALVAALVAAGVTANRALAGVLLYRIVSFWLVMAAGWALVVFLTRTRRGSANTT